jgi:hypothetical protein
MKKFLLLLLLPVLFTTCKNKKTRLTDDEVVEIDNFIDFFPEAKLPLRITDAMLDKKESDSSLIGNRVFSQFVPDSVISSRFGKTVKPKIYPIGKVSVKKGETYLFVKAVTSSKKIAYILAFNKDDKFISSMPVVVKDKDASTSQVGTMDTKYSITTLVQRKNPNGVQEDTKNVYVLNADAAMFMLILTDAVVPDTKADIINPIDTFPRKTKFAGDYIKDKRNYISIRDGRNSSQLLFFTHFEKDNGQCTGELKGTASINSAKTAVFRANGNPCVLEFSFSSAAVSMKEVEACGSYRDIKCFFEGTYHRKKEIKPKKPGSRKA